MRDRLILLMMLLLAVAVHLSGESLLVEYVEGILEVGEGADWIEVDIGETIQSDKTLRLHEESYAELSVGDVHFTLNRSGTYEVESLLRSGREMDTWNVQSIISARLDKLTGSKDEIQSATMGVRGASKGEGQVKWVDEGEEQFLEGMALLKDGQWQAAARVFQEGADYALNNEEKERYLFFASYAHTKMGRNAKALAIVDGMDPSPKTEYYTDFVLLKGRLLMATLDFSAAARLFETYLDTGYATERTRQVMLFLSAMCYRELDRTDKARERLQECYRLNPTSDHGQLAKRMLNSF